MSVKIDSSSSLVKRSWPLYLNTFILSSEVIIVETIFVITTISTITVAAIGILIAGVILTSIHRTLRLLTNNNRSDLVIILAASLGFSLGQLLLLDSIAKIGSGKTQLLSMPAETIFVVSLAWVFLRERPIRVQLIGMSIVIIGCFLSAVSGSTASDYTFTIGDLEAIFSSLFFAVHIILVSKLMKRKYSSLEVTSFILLFSGIIMVSTLWIVEPSSLSQLDNIGWIYCILFALFPIAEVLTFYMGIKRVGAGLASVTTSISIILTIMMQLVIINLGVALVLPANLTVALIGGMVSISGLYIIYRGDDKK